MMGEGEEGGDGEGRDGEEGGHGPRGVQELEVTGMGRRWGWARVRLEARPRWSAHPFGGIECRGTHRHLLLYTFASEVARLGCTYTLWSIICPSYTRNSFSSLQSPCLLLLEEVCSGQAHCNQGVPGPLLPQIHLSDTIQFKMTFSATCSS